MPKSFKGVVKLNIDDSTPDWEPFLEQKAPKGAPNVLVILYDDTGLATWSAYGGRVEMPTLDRLAKNGLTYTQWHTVALCSPTRSCFLTGRNHHQNGYASLSEVATGFPGHSGHIPAACAPMARVLRDAGWSTFWVGKDHNVPADSWHMGSSRKEWPLAQGYDRFYGFLGGETNQWFPDLVHDNHYVDQPYSPENGYHLSKDLADKALQFIRDSKQSAPDKPWYLWYCPGANHAPHHAPQEYIDKYKGQFDDGYEAYREWVLPRMIERGILPAGTELTPLNPMPKGTFFPPDAVRPWETLSPDEKRLFSRMAEVFAGFSEYTDVQIGRVIDYLQESGQLDNTLIVYCADNGASGEGSPNGSVNENKFFNMYPDDIKENLANLEKLGGPGTYNHYPTGWAVAFSTPFRMFKRYSYQGGICDPLVIHWPKGFTAKGEVRNQYHHVTDIVPMILECCGVEMPNVVDGVEQTPLPGVSMRYSFAADGATQKRIQYYEMMGTRAIWADGWKAVTLHGPVSEMGQYDQDQWQLFHTDVDRAEAHDLAAQEPARLEKLKALWLEEARKNDVLPISDHASANLPKGMLFRVPVAASGQFTYYPGTAEVPEASAAPTCNSSFKILADVDFTPKSEGVIVAQGSRFGGFSLFVKGGKLTFVLNFLGIKPEQTLTADAPSSGRHIVGVEFTKAKAGPNREPIGPARLHIDDKTGAEAEIRTIYTRYGLSGEGLCVGYDGGDAVSAQYTPKFEFTGGTIHKVVFDVADDQYADVEQHFAAAMARD
jgi:arylsulfatase